MENLLGNNLLKVIIIFLLISFITSKLAAQNKLTEYVNPFIGTDAHGHTYPGASMPFGMVQLSPDTDTKGWDWCSGYHYSDNSIIGFSHTHLSGTGVGDYGDILFMPTTGHLITEPGTKDKPSEGYRSTFSHKNEIAAPGYYSVLLERYYIKAELTVTTRAGFHKYTFPKSEDAHILIDLVHGIQDKITEAEINIIGDNVISGFRKSTGWANEHTVYFYADFSKPFNSSGISDNDKILPGIKHGKGKSIKAFVDYKTGTNESILVKVGISHTSIEGAKNNVLNEISSWDFDNIRNTAAAAWEKSLSSIEIETSSIKDKRIFYTALYHSLLSPNIFSDADGSYTGMDKAVHKSDKNIYTVLSLWDVFRAALPLITILDPQRSNEFVHTLLSKYRESGLLPVWELAANETNTMIGYHSVPVIADALIKGINDFDVLEAFNAMKKSAMQDHNGLSYYKQMGFIPSDHESESVSKTLEYAYDDWCISQAAKYLWDKNILSSAKDDYYYFLERAKYYINIFDPSTSLMRAKKNGRWFEPFDPYAVSGNYTEANAWQYSFFVPQDVNGLISLMGGDDKFVNMLDQLFNADTKLTGRFQSDITGLIGQYAHGNEPSHHMAYLYNYAGAPYKTQEKVYRILKELHSDKPDGLPGNEDCGQMSAWYVLSAMGFYPVTPGDNNYIIGTPLFESVRLNTGSGKVFNIRAENISDKNIYIQSVQLNGKSYPYSYLKHDDVMAGGEMVFIMGPVPSNWGSEKQNRPVSEINFNLTPVPFITSGERVFKDSVVVGINSIDSSSELFYSLDDSFPSVIYSGPIVLKKTTKLKAAAVNNGSYSKIVSADFSKLPEGRSIQLFSEYSPSYTGGGPEGLIDGIKGNSNFRTDAWQGYEGVDFEAVVDLGKIQNISGIDVSFLKNTGSWIFFPESVNYFVSVDGKFYHQVYERRNSSDESSAGEGIIDFVSKLSNVQARFVKITGMNIGKCPDWHVGAGGKAWIFVDEITINN